MGLPAPATIPYGTRPVARAAATSSVPVVTSAMIPECASTDRRTGGIDHVFSGSAKYARHTSLVDSRPSSDVPWPAVTRASSSRARSRSLLGVRAAAPCVEGKVDQDRHRDSAERRHHWNREPPALSQLAEVELPLGLQTHHQESNRRPTPTCCPRIYLGPTGVDGGQVLAGRNSRPFSEPWAVRAAAVSHAPMSSA